MSSYDGAPPRVLGRLVRVLAAVALVGLVALPSPAAAHARLTGSTPSQGQHLDALPAEVVFEFSQDIAPPAYVIVTAPDGSTVTRGDPVVSGSSVSQAVDGGSDGTYTMAYRAVSEDGHPVSGEITFTVGTGGPAASAGASPSAAAESPQPEASQESAGAAAEEPSWWDGNELAILVGAGLFLAAGLMALAARRA